MKLHFSLSTLAIYVLVMLAFAHARPRPQSAAVPSGRCGRDFGMTTCQNFPGEFCCSQYGFCGATSDHCEPQTCQFGCDNKDPFLPGILDPRKSTPANASCTTTPSTSTPTQPPTFVAPTPPIIQPPPSNQSTPAVPNGRCGRDFGFASCQRYPGEFCCSEFGFCGGTADHCKAETCQFGCDNRDPFLQGKETPKRDAGLGSMQLPETDENGSVKSCKIPGTISITYDDGPSPLTSSLLNTLNTLNVKTTFFVIGSNIANPGMREVLIDADRRGHDIASHSFTHSNFLTLSDQQIQEEITKTEDAIFNAIGKRPRYFRPPFGAMDGRVANIVKSMGYKIILWNLDTNDWRQPDDIQAYEASYSTAFSGRNPSTSAFISLQHDIHQGTVNFAQRVHELAIRSGYQPRSVSNCLEESAYKN